MRNPSPGPSPKQGGEKNPDFAPPSLPGKGVGGLGSPAKDYWRSLEDLADTPEFRAFAREEFPGFVNVYESLGEAELKGDDAAGLDRRKFLALSAAALGLAGLAGCRRPEIQILPYSATPADQVGHVVPGKPAFYATSIPRPGGALPVLVESHEGRPTKIEGNPVHPCSRGATDAHAQATVLDLYSPDRVMSDKYPGVMEKGIARRWEDFDTFARAEADRLIKEQGKGFYVLAEELNSPSVRLIRAHMKSVMPEASWHTYEPIDYSEIRKGAEIAIGAKLAVRYNLDKAERILTLDSDFLGLDPEQIHNSRGFAARRKVDAPTDRMSRLYAVESTYTVTGTMADHRLALPSARIGGFLAAVATELASVHKSRLKRTGSIPAQVAGITAPAELPGKWVAAVAKDLAENAGKSVVLVGYRQPAWVHALAHAVNDSLGNIDAGVVEFRDPPPETADKGIAELVKDIAADKVGTLFVIGGNPALNAPADLNFKAALQKVTRKVRLGLFHDHTSELCDWHLPLAHDLEGWGDAEAVDGTLCCVQPLIAPLNGAPAADAMSDVAPPPRGGRTVLEVLTLLTQFVFPDADAKTNLPTTSYSIARTKAYELVRRAFADRAGIEQASPTFDTELNRYKQLGFLPADRDKTGRKPRPAAEVKLDAGRVGGELAKVQLPPAPARDAVEVGFVPSYSVYDGRFAMNPWLQELPDPITKLVWDNAALISPKSAAELKLKTGDGVKLTVGGAAVEIPVFVLPGQADWAVTLPFGQPGEMRIGRVPEGGGTNVFPVRRSDALHFAGGCKLESTGRAFDLVTTQEHGVIPEGREIIKEYALADYPKPQAEHTHGHETGAEREPKIGLAPTELPHEKDIKKGYQGAYGNPQQPRGPARQKQERFPLDLARPELLDSQFQWGMVIDLNACTGCSACMIACQSENNIPVVGKAEVKRNREMHWIRIDRYFTAGPDEPRVVSQPVACVHCEQAPCEQVCPVNAAVHSPEGLNVQVYNRCIGTRYCANACPYKVRRFNWFDFNKRPLDQLRVPTPFADGGASLTHTLLPETLKMQKNPDVTVRMRGVMEKCTYCVQRLERAKYGAKIAATEVAQGRKVIGVDAAFKPDGPPSAYRKPADPRAAGYDLDAKGRVIVPDGMVTTACAAACPTQAIVFGNALDPTSLVAKQKAKEAEYLLLGELNTKPRTSYLPRVRNPNPELAG
ncbi:MAG: 4Fe-4S ferredoxin [Gemmataceae bacterium]|nr:4Fe-4S ferredoxin [Gemmataceae bacterium]